MSENKKNNKVKVLWQNLGGTWYAFTNVGDDVFFGRVNLQQVAPKEAAKAAIAAPSKAKRPTKRP